MANDALLIPDAFPTELAAPSIASILDGAVRGGMPPEALEKLVALYERLEDRKAAQAFAEAMAAFKAECPPVPRRAENSQFSVTVNGAKRNRRYAALEDIEATIRGPLGKHGLSFRWGETKMADGMLSMACIVSHVGGHSESANVVLPVDSRAGCSDQQKFGSAMTYAQRYSLIQALGLTTCDEDADGAAPKAEANRISEHQRDLLDSLMNEVNADRPKFLRFMGYDRIEDITTADFQRAVSALEGKRRKQ